MHGAGKSDQPVVPEKVPNKETQTETSADARVSSSPPSAEALEGRGRTKGNTPQSYRLRTQRRECLQQALERVREAAAAHRTAQFTSIWHMVYDVERLLAAYLCIK